VLDGEDAIPPANPDRIGYTFTGWDQDFHQIKSDTVNTALYDVNFLNVIFKYDFDTIWATQRVGYGSPAPLPTSPEKEGYTFIGWDKDVNNITADVTTTAKFEINQYKGVFKDMDGSILESKQYSTAHLHQHQY
jgi:uncharacterized repeat protein (TIGR02543 family)